MRSEAGRTGLYPQDIRDRAFPVARRGYDRERVDRFLAFVADAYASTLETSSFLRRRVRLLEMEIDAAEGEAAASARAVAELMMSSVQRSDTASQRQIEELEQRLERSEREHEQALADLASAALREGELRARLHALEDGHSGDEVADGGRARALEALRKARELASLMHERAVSERTEVAEAQARRDVDREADELLARTRDEAEMIDGAVRHAAVTD